MTQDLRPAITRHDELIAATGVQLESDERHQLLVRMRRIATTLNELDLWRDGLHLGALPPNDVTDGEDDSGKVRPMGTLHLELTGFADDFSLVDVADALVAAAVGLLKGRA